MSSLFRKGPCLYKFRGELLRKILVINFWLSHSFPHICTCISTHTHTLPHICTCMSTHIHVWKSQTHTHEKKERREEGRKMEGWEARKSEESCTSWLPNLKLSASETSEDTFSVLAFHRKTWFLYLGLRESGCLRWSYEYTWQYYPAALNWSYF